MKPTTKAPRSAQSIIEQLNSNLPVVVEEPKVTTALSIPAPSHNTPSEENLVSHSEEDYEYIRQKMKAMIEESEEAIKTMSDVASGSQSPRAFEVLDNMLRHTANMAKQLMDLQKDRRSMFSRVPTAAQRFVPNGAIGNDKPAPTTNNAIFVGSTAELQKFLKAQAEGVDLTAPEVDEDEYYANPVTE